MKSYKIAVIGCGRIVGHHLDSIQSLQGLKIISVCDIDETKCLEYSKKYNVSYFTNYHKMMRSLSEIDLVVIATPSGMHYEHAMDIMKLYKKSVIIEKPTFMRIDQLQKAYYYANNNNLKIYPVFQNRYNVAVQRVKKALDNKELGDIRIMNVRLRWCRPQRYYDLSDWRGTYAQDGGALSNQGIHHIDLLRYLGGEVHTVNSIMKTFGAEIEVEDSVVSIFNYKSGSIGSLEVTTSARPDDFEASISIVGSEGLAQLGGVAVNKLEIFTPNPKDCDKYSDDFLDLPDRGRVYGRGHKNMYIDIEKSLFEGVDYPINQSDCLSTISFLHSFYVSDEMSSPVEVGLLKQSSRLGKEDKNLSKLYQTKL